jgi:hypothetical protein
VLIKREILILPGIHVHSTAWQLLAFHCTNLDLSVRLQKKIVLKKKTVFESRYTVVVATRGPSARNITIQQ